MGERPKAKMPVEEVRRASLRNLVESYPGTKQSFARLMPFGASRLSQLIGTGSTERFTEQTAAAIEKALNLTPGSMSRAEGPQLADRGLDLPRAAAISQAVTTVAVSMGLMPSVEQMEQIIAIAADNAKRTGHVDTDMVASVTRALLAK